MVSNCLAASFARCKGLVSGMWRKNRAPQERAGGSFCHLLWTIDPLPCSGGFLFEGVGNFLTKGSNKTPPRKGGFSSGFPFNPTPKWELPSKDASHPCVWLTSKNCGSSFPTHRFLGGTEQTKDFHAFFALRSAPTAAGVGGAEPDGGKPHAAGGVLSGHEHLEHRVQVARPARAGRASRPRSGREAGAGSRQLWMRAKSRHRTS